MNKYRVDRNNSLNVPVGMNSIQYIGDNWMLAHKAFDRTDAGVDAWGNPAVGYGVLLSMWDSVKGEYVIQMHKGFK